MDRKSRNSSLIFSKPDTPPRRKHDDRHSKPIEEHLNVVGRPSNIAELLPAIGRTPNLVINNIKSGKNESQVSAPIRAFQNKLPSIFGSYPTKQCVTEGSLSQTQYQALMLKQKDIIHQNIKKTQVRINQLEAQLQPTSKKIKELLIQRQNEKREKEKLISQMNRLIYVKASQIRSLEHEYEKRVIEVKLIELGESKYKQIERISLEKQNQILSKYIQQMNEELNKMNKNREQQKTNLKNIQDSHLPQLLQEKESEVYSFNAQIDHVITKIRRLEMVRQPIQTQLKVLYKQLANYRAAQLKLNVPNVLLQEK